MMMKSSDLPSEEMKHWNDQFLKWCDHAVYKWIDHPCTTLVLWLSTNWDLGSKWCNITITFHKLFQDHHMIDSSDMIVMKLSWNKYTTNCVISLPTITFYPISRITVHLTIALWKQKCIYAKGIRRSFHTPHTCETFCLIITNQNRWRSYQITNWFDMAKLIAFITHWVLKSVDRNINPHETCPSKSQYLWDLNWWMNPFGIHADTSVLWKPLDYLHDMEMSLFN